MMFMIAAALHVDSDVRVFCHNENDSRYVARMIDRLGLPVKMEAPKQSVANRWEYFMPTVYKSIVYRGGQLLLDGYFQSYRYFTPDEVATLFSCPPSVDAEIESQFGRILKDYETVSVHVRRGDYLTLPDRFPFVGKAYLRRAMRRFSNRNVAFIFTGDDIAWVKKHFKGNNIFYSEGNSEYFDLFLATKCRHNILSNSTFSWWGAYLNRHADKRVIAPRRWYGPVLYREANARHGQLLPDDWEQLPCRWDSVKAWLRAYYTYWRCYWRDVVPFVSYKAK
jgi:hypothetical protein